MFLWMALFLLEFSLSKIRKMGNSTGPTQPQHGCTAIELFLESVGHRAYGPPTGRLKSQKWKHI